MAHKKSKSPKPVSPPRKRRGKIAVITKTRPPVMDMDEVLRRINYVQVERKDSEVFVDVLEGAVIQHLLKDAGVEYNKISEDENVVTFGISPGQVEDEGVNALDSLEELDDEIIEDGQIF
jgi:hypothetical protein